MSAAGITIDIDGEAVDLADVLWVIYAPCGCPEGWRSAWSPGLAIVTAEQAAEACGRRLSAAERVEDQGSTFVATRRTDAPKPADCPHIPQWGSRWPLPDGYAWATGGDYGDSRARRHAVPVEGVLPEPTSWKDYQRGPEVKPLCKGKVPRRWSEDAARLMGKAHCTRCMKACEAAYRQASAVVEREAS